MCVTTDQYVTNQCVCDGKGTVTEWRLQLQRCTDLIHRRPMLPISDVDKVKPMLLPHGGWPMAAGPASRLGSIEPGEKTWLRLSPTPTVAQLY